MSMTDASKNITPVDGHVKMSERKCAVCGYTFSNPHDVSERIATVLHCTPDEIKEDQ